MGYDIINISNLLNEGRRQMREGGSLTDFFDLVIMYDVLF